MVLKWSRSLIALKFIEKHYSFKGLLWPYNCGSVLLNELINQEGYCKTAPATPGLLKSALSWHDLSLITIYLIWTQIIKKLNSSMVSRCRTQIQEEKKLLTLPFYFLQIEVSLKGTCIVKKQQIKWLNNNTKATRLQYLKILIQ